MPIPANRAPTLDAGKSPALTAELEDAGAPVGAVGTLVSSLVDFAVPAGQGDNVTDSDTGALLGIALTATDTTRGSWFYSTNGGTTWITVGTVSDTSALLLAADANTRLYFQPNPNWNGGLAAAITFRAWDQTTGIAGTQVDTSVNGGTSAFSATTDTASLTVISVNDPPVATNLSAPETYTEDTPLNLTDIVVSDLDSANVTVSLTLSDPAAGALNSATAGSVTSSFTAGVWTAAGNIADVNTLLAGLTFTPAANYNSTFTLATSVSDGIAPALTGTKTMTSIPVNDPPVATNLSAPETYTEDTPLNLTDIVVSDLDSANVTVSLTLSDPAAGALNSATAGSVTSSFTAGVWTAAGNIADVNTLLAGLTFTPAANYNSTFTLATSVSDGIAPALTGTKTMTSIPVNDPPVATNLSAPETYTEDTPLNLTDIVVSDLDSANVTVSLTLSDPAAGALNSATAGSVTSSFTAGVWTAAGNIADVNTLLAGLTFTPAANYNSTFTLATSVSDGIAPALTGTKTMTSIPVNDPPVATNLSAPETYTEDTPLNLTDIVVSDLDSANVTVSLTLSDPAAGALNSATAGSVTSSFTAGVWTAAGNIADVNTLLAGLTFTPAANYNSTFTLATSVSDGIAPALTGTKTMTSIPVNDPPVATNLSAPETYTEDTPLNLTDIVVSDLDSANVTVSLTLSDPAAGALNSATAGSVTSSFTAGVWTAAGNIADVNTLLAGLTFTPAANYNSTFTLATSVSDGIAPALTGTKTMTSIPVNDPPVATNLSAPETYTEDTPLNLTDIVVSDLDSANVTVSLTLSDPAAGALNSATAGSVTSSFTAGVWTAAGNIADVNTLLAGLTFTPAANYNSTFTLATSVSDGIAPALTGTKTMTSIPVNDPPVATNLSAPETYTEDTPLNLTDIVVSDLDSANVTVSLTLSDPAAGALNSATAGSVTSSFTAGVWTAAGNIADVNTLLAGLTFTPAANYNSTFTLATSVSDGIAPALTGTKTMTSIPVNDPPVATNLSAPETYTEDTPLNLTDIVVSDLDSANVTVSLTLSDPAAGALNSATAGSVTSSFTAGVWTAAGNIADVNTLLAGLTFTPAANYNSTFTLATSVSDGIAPALTGTKTMTSIPVNDPPVATNLSAPETYTEDTPLNLTDIVVSDLDSANVTVSLTLSDPAAGALNSATAGSVTSSFTAGVWTAAGNIADVNTLLAGLTFTPAANYNSTFTLATSVSDGIAPALTGTKTMTSIPVNDPPVATNLSAPETYTEDTPLNLTDIVVSDLDSANVTVSLTLSDPAAGALNSATAGSVTSSFTAGVWTAAGNIADVNTLLAGLTFTPAANYNSTFTLATSVSDGIAPALTGTKTMTSIPVNDPPVATNLSAPETYTEDTPLNLTDIVVSDLDSANVTVSLTLSDPAAGALNSATAGSVTSSFTAGVWTAAGNIADVNTLLAGLTFTPAANYNSTFTLATSVSDGIAPALTGTKTMTSIPVNDPPVATNLSAPETYTEDTPLNLTDIVVSDLDSANVTVSLTLSDPAAGALNSATAGSVTSSFTAGVWTAAGNIADVNTLLAGLTFTPAANYNSTFTLATSVSDGIAPALTGTKTMTSIPVNDPPVATNLSAPETYTEDTPLNLTDIVVSDLDSANVTVSLTLSDPAAGALNSATAGSVTSSFTAGVWTAAGNIADVNTLLAGLTFTPAANYNSTFTLATSVSDGIAPALTGTKTMTSIPVNDPPVANDDAATVTRIRAPTRPTCSPTTRSCPTPVRPLTITRSARARTVVLNAGNTFTYTPAATFSGADSFTYTISTMATARPRPPP